MLDIIIGILIFFYGISIGMGIFTILTVWRRR
jgi:hypothetical protein